MQTPPITTPKNLSLHTVKNIVAAATIAIPAMSFFFVFYLFLQGAIAIHDWALFFVMFLFGGFGITVGYHRLFSHVSFKAKPWFKVLLGIMGSASAQGPLLFWVDIHRRHHKFSDKEGDPHSPYFFDNKVTIKGFFRAHFSWMFEEISHSWTKEVRDLIRDKQIMWVHQNYTVFLLLGILTPGLFSLIFEPSLFGFFKGLLIGGLFRIFITQHVTWAVNSCCHVFGFRSYQTTDHSTNFWPIGLLALGEGWHNNHHAFPYSARQGLRFWQIDPSYYFLRMLSIFGVVWDLKYPRQDRHMKS